MKNILRSISNEVGNRVFLKLSVLSLIILFTLPGCEEETVEKDAGPKATIKEPLKIPADSAQVSVSSEFEYLLVKYKIDPEKVLNGKIRYEYIKNVDSLDIVFYGSNKNLKGIEYFTNLRFLKVRGYYSTVSLNPNIYYYAFPTGVNADFIPSIDTLDVSNNLKLEYLDCSGSSEQGGYASTIGNLVLGSNLGLKTIISNSSMVKSLDLSGLSNLENLEIVSCYNLTSLSLCKNSALVRLKSLQVRTIYVPSLNLLNPKWETGMATLMQCK
ncbi:hypothetical protein ACFP1I_24055 [Dyadobacter subterraneus]|uniref:Leucine-rich repeat domain-containing protein n=1 Tax=Dyadobacter subterraneus TaxID=2773304 RepID=A0ABR9WLT8_9BACT|nr:hypothetical protein [Dyadobacter subterraneus]MBE9466478.1 hypothetical protein [Dyadobacter subterraneus]